MFSIENFSGNPELYQVLKEVTELLKRCEEFVKMKTPAVVYSHVTVHTEQANEILADATQKICELNLAYHYKNTEYVKIYRSRVEAEVMESNKSNRWQAESMVNGDPVVADLKQMLSVLKTLADTLGNYSWLIKEKKAQTVELFEKSK